MKNRSYLTAIRRKKASLPMRWILKNVSDYIYPCLDYGCGFGTDADIFEFEGWDPYYRPYGMKQDSYNTIFCIYVLNTIPSPIEREDILLNIQALLNPGGAAYIAVRNDVGNLKGLTKRGTWQGKISLPFPAIEVNSQFVIYKMEKI